MSSAHSYDVIVIGGGPGGSLVASLVRRQDPSRKVLVLEREVFPRHHVGESTIPGWRPILERAGMLAKLEASDVMRKVGTLFQWGEADDEQWTVDFRDERTGGATPGSYQVDRARFDHMLLEHARSLDATVIEAVSVKAVDRLDPKGFRVHWEDASGARQSATSEMIVDASGQTRLLARLFGLRVIPFDDMNNFAVYGYWKGSKIAHFAGPRVHPHERWTYIATSPDGWIWHIPTHPDLVSVGLVTDADVIPSGGAAALEQLYLANVRGAEGVRDLLEGAELVNHPLSQSRLLVVRDWAYRVEEAAGEGYFLVGDAAAFVDPILSSGLSITAHGASLAANALHTLWTDPSIDVGLLRASYNAAYFDMASSYHRLARIWYSRNFKQNTWHWEAKRQRLRRGDLPGKETDAEAFFRQSLGAFVNPVEGAFGDAGTERRDIEPNMRVLSAHLFKGEGGKEVKYDHADVHAARRAIREEGIAKWRTLLDRRLSLRGCTCREQESYFTDRAKDRWEKVRYTELAPLGEADRFHRLVQPAGSIALLLRGEATLREVVRVFASGPAIGTRAHDERVELAQQQILQLDLRGFLDPGAGPLDDTAERPPWPPPVVAMAREGGAPLDAEVDLVGDSVSLGPAASRILIMSAAIAPKGFYYGRTDTTAFAYREKTEAGRAKLERLMEGFRAWEKAEPEAALAFWRRVGARAGEASKIE